MLIERSMHSGWLSNTWLVADREGGSAVLIDTGGPMEPILKRIEELRLNLTHVLCTHHHYDHVEHNSDYRERFGCPICGHANERELFGDLDAELKDGQELESGNLRIRSLWIPGHTSGQLAFLVNEEHVFTGDTLFRGSIGGTCGPDHTTYEDIRHSILEKLMKLPPETHVHPGHMQSSSIAEEWESNPFLRMWRGVDSPAERDCLAFGRPARLLLSAPDYDGGTKCQVRYENGEVSIVPGSKVKLR